MGSRVKRVDRAKTSGIALGVVVLALLAIAAPASAALRTFTQRFGENARGNIAFASNTLTHCPITGPQADGSCNVSGVSANQVLNAANNARRIKLLDVDSDPTTETSSRATLTLPPGAKVIFAGLYWAGNVLAPGDADPFSESDPNDVNDFKHPLIDTPGPGGYQTVTGTAFDTSGTVGSGNSIGAIWNSFANITSLVQSAGPGDYLVGGVPIRPNPTFANGVSSEGGWALWVAYEDPAQPWRNLSVFDGFIGPPQAFSVSGFVTPPSGAFNTAIGVSAVEGDGGGVGDAMKVNTTTLQDAATPSNDFFNSRITRFGVDQGDRTPNFLNQLGWDTKLVDADAVNPTVIPNGATSANVTITTAGDGYYANAITTAIDIFNPDITATKTVKNVDRPNATDAHAGETLQYMVNVANATGSKSDAADDVVLRDAIPQDTTYVPGSLEMVSGNPAPVGARSDSAGNDSAEFDGGNDRVVFRLGSGANGVNGGSIAPGASSTVRFRVTVDAGFPNGQSATNQAHVDFTGATTNEVLDADSNEVKTPVSSRVADLELSKAGTSVVNPGGPLTWTLTVRNNGPEASTGSTITDTLPAGVTGVVVPGGCNLVAQTVTCNVGPLGRNGVRQFVITGTAPNSPSTCFTNSATVDGQDTDPAGGNDDATAKTCTTPAADLELKKTAAPIVDPGDQVTWTLTVTNKGPDPSSGSTVTDTLPGNVGTVTSPTPGCNVGANTVTCAVGPLAPNASTQIVIKGNAPNDPATCFENDASVDGVEGDPQPGNDDAHVRTCTTPVSDLELTKSAPAVVNPGDQVTWTLKVKNKGPNGSSGALVTDTLPAGVTNVQTSTPGCSLQGNTLNCDVDPLGSSQMAQIQVTGDAPNTPSTCFENNALVTGNEADSDTTNDRAKARTCTTAAADLELTKTATPSLVQTGGQITWTLTVTNKGPDASTGATVSDVVPGEVTGVQSATPGCTVTGNAVTCDVGPLAPNGSTNIVITGTAPNTLATCMQNDARVLGNEADPVTGNDRDSARTCTPPAADLQIVKNADKATASVGEHVTYSLDVTNTGPSISNPTVVTDTLPGNVTLVSADPRCNTAALPTITCDIADLQLAENDSIQIVVEVDVGAGNTTLLNTASITGPLPDFALADNQDTASTDAKPVVGLSITKQAVSDTVEAGGEITYKLHVANAGPSPATDVQATDDLPTGLSFVSATPTQGSCNATDPVSCALGTIPSGGSADVTLIARAGADQGGNVIENAASVDATETDAVLADNTDQAQARVLAAVVKGEFDTAIVKKPLTANRAKTILRFVALRGGQREGGATFSCKLDRPGKKGRVKSCRKPIIIKGLEPGKYHFEVFATSRTGEVDGTPAKADFTVKPKPD
ncbi:MAG: hypothetical protein QOG62_1382 [Thermoleophilaceae bacterium]|nr:hypothetical protein [Thermoleophilaceae bacterium]